MTIRSTLRSFFMFLGVALILSLAANLYQGVSYYREAGLLVDSNAGREHLARAASLLADERRFTHLRLSEAPSSSADNSSAMLRTDAELEAASAAMFKLGDTATNTLIQGVAKDLKAQRDFDNYVLATGSSVSAGNQAAVAYRAYGTLIDQITRLRLALLLRYQPSDPQVALAFELRRSINTIIDQSSRSRLLIVSMMNKPVGSRPILIAEVTKISDQEEFLLNGLADQLGIDDAAIRKQIVALTSQSKTQLIPIQRALIYGLTTGEDLTRTYATWTERMDLVQNTSLDLQEQLFAYSNLRLEQQRFSAFGRLIIWFIAAFLCGVAYFLSMRFVQRRIVRPLADLRANMLKLASGDIGVDLHNVTGRMDEIGGMTDALRVFKATAMRRSRLQEDRLALHGRLKHAYRQLKEDLEAAAIVQSALLPRPSRIRDVEFVGHHEPSHFVAGDSYSVLPGPSGRVAFFLIDVAGHGAAAGLASVAAHHIVMQAILQRSESEPLVATAEKINSRWPSNLPFFTMILGEVDRQSGKGTLVQAGHPNPVLLQSSGAMLILGNGGLPIGVLPVASYEETTFRFDAGDKLLIYSDGFTDTHSDEGIAFSDERLHSLLNANLRLPTAQLMYDMIHHLRAWQGSTKLQDDVTILILEAQPKYEDDIRRAGQCLDSALDRATA